MPNVGDLIAEVKQRPAVAIGVIGAGAIGVILVFRTRTSSASDGSSGAIIVAPAGSQTKPAIPGNDPIITPGTPPGASKPPDVITKPDTTTPGTPKPVPSTQPIKTITETQRARYKCPSGSTLTWEKGNTGNLVCERKDGVQFAVTDTTKATKSTTGKTGGLV